MTAGGGGVYSPLAPTHDQRPPHPDDVAATSAALDKLARGEPTIGLENRFRGKNASYRRLAWTAIPTPEGLLYAVARDITERGLTVILAQTQLMQRHLGRGETLTLDQLATRLANISGAGMRMRGMTQNLLDASLQQSARPLALLLARTELVALTRAAVSEHQLISADHLLLFQAEVPALEATVDETRVHRVLANLLTNAIGHPQPSAGMDTGNGATSNNRRPVERHQSMLSGRSMVRPVTLWRNHWHGTGDRPVTRSRAG